MVCVFSSYAIARASNIFFFTRQTEYQLDNRKQLLGFSKIMEFKINHAREAMMKFTMALPLHDLFSAVLSVQQFCVWKVPSPPPPRTCLDKIMACPFDQSLKRVLLETVQLILLLLTFSSITPVTVFLQISGLTGFTLVLLCIMVICRSCFSLFLYNCIILSLMLSILRCKTACPPNVCYGHLKYE